MSSGFTCPLCNSSHLSDFYTDKKRHYLQCQECQLVIAQPDSWMPAADEKAIYDLHQNSPEDEGYLKFLDRVIQPIKLSVTTGAKGLDFGSGPSPVLANELIKAGFNMRCYDIFYCNDKSALQHTYDFISCTEAIEHFYQPGKIWQQWMQLLAPAGSLFIMTKRVINKERFSTWHYKNDPTHICFFSEFTFHWLANRYELTLEFPSNDVAVFKLPG